MNKFYFILILAFFISCKQEVRKTHSPKKIEKVKENDIEAFYISSDKINQANSNLLISFYESKNNKTVWLSSKQRKIILDALNNSFQEGLNPKDYEVTVLNAFERRKKSLPNPNGLIMMC